ncbi:calcium-binding protein [Sulfitobacter aestuariivivens]|uniref:Calcium-binding protein n=1 Tax=Sulfitobacter aestuariivivens TaxID=2766981 RepID=A0A927HEY7_9RHOB|nr:hypothetical protein [Sulfitobacter aestuariivivens]MBD3664376.1 hypothetical protein [Sulfitobacter aestuariivivens]
MSPFLLLGLMALGLSLPHFVNDDDLDDTDTQEPTDPAETIVGTAGDDALVALDNQILNGLDGNDILSTDDLAGAATLDGGLGTDTLTGSGTDILLAGGGGADVLTLETAFDPATEVSSSANGGDGDDTITATGIGGSVDGGGADDVISVQGAFETITGGNGDDTIVSDSADFGGGTPVDGGAGNDDITISDNAGTGFSTQINGGDGNDAIRSMVLWGDATSADVLTGGAGADSFTVGFIQLGANDGTLGQVMEITDFDPAEDQLAIDLSGFDIFGDDNSALNSLNFDLLERADGTGTDLVFTVQNGAATGDLTGNIFLSNATGIDPAAIVFTIADAA